MQRRIFSHLETFINHRMPVLGGSWLTGYFVTSITKRISSLSTSSSSSNRNNITAKTTTKMDNSTFSTSTIKPPNILVYTGTVDKENNFVLVRNHLFKTINIDAYTVYPLDDQKVLEHPWSKNSALLIIYSNIQVQNNIMDEFKSYIKSGGHILSVGCKNCHELVDNVEFRELHRSEKACNIDVNAESLNFQERELELECQGSYFTGLDDQEIDILASEKESGHPVILYSKQENSKLILSAVDIFQGTSHSKHLLRALLEKLDMKCIGFELPQLTHGWLFAKEKDKLKLMDLLNPHLQDDLICKGQKFSLQFCESSAQLSITHVTEELLPVMLDESHYKKGLVHGFDWEVYSKHLNTHTLGKLLIYTDVIYSTQTLLEGNSTFVNNIPQDAGIIAVTSRQLKGKGRGGNAWLSPAGCMMFSIVAQVQFGTELGLRLPYIQHIASLALILAVKTIPGYENINICLKWPNDIYYGKEVKIGGVVISSSAIGNTLNAVIGMGVNISNKEPTVCINDIIAQYNTDNNTDLQPLKLEVVLARTVNYMEELINSFQWSGKEPFLQKYYKHWMHSGSSVTLNTGQSPLQVEIIGLDDYGFLLVKKDSGETISLQPDGNTFDILANLIEIKT